MSSLSDRLWIAKNRTELAKTALEEGKVDSMIFFNGDRYGRKFAGTQAFTALLILPEDSPILIARSIERDHAEDETWMEVKEVEKIDGLGATIQSFLPKESAKVAILSWTTTYHMVQALLGIGVEIIDAGKNILGKCLSKPFPEELEEIRKLSSICDEGLKAAEGTAKAGRREYEVAAEADHAMKRKGVTEYRFPTLVASGNRAAFPHGWTSSKEIRRGDSVVVDLGPIIEGYDGCVCRTFTTGHRWKKEVMVVREAIHDALEILQNQDTPPASLLDRTARESIMKAGYRNWPDMPEIAAGHPIGGFCAPMICPGSDDLVEEGMVFAIEPGIYIKGEGGVRIEHHILTQKYGYEILDKFPEA